MVKLKAIFIAFLTLQFFAHAQTLPQPSTLKKVANIPGTGLLYGSTIVGPSVDNKIYIIGGTSSPLGSVGNSISKIWKFDLATNAVTQLDISLPYGYCNFSPYCGSILPNGKIYLSPSTYSGPNHSQIIEIDPDAGTVVQKAILTNNYDSSNIWGDILSTPAPDGGIYFFTNFGAIYHYDPISDCAVNIGSLWLKFPYDMAIPLPTGSILVYGSATDSYEPNSKPGYLFDPQTNSIRQVFAGITFSTTGINQTPLYYANTPGSWIDQVGVLHIVHQNQNAQPPMIDGIILISQITNGYGGANLNPTVILPIGDISFTSLARNTAGDTLYFFGRNSYENLPSAEIWSMKVGNTPPLLDPISDQTVNENEPLAFTVSGSDSDNNNLTFSASNLPPGASFDANTRTFNWTPTYTQSGTYPVMFNVTDDGYPHMQATQTVSITVNSANRPPVLAAIGNQMVNENQLLQFLVSASDPDGDQVTLAAANLPADASFDSTTGVFSWTPPFGQAGNYIVTFTATDSHNAISSNTVGINVNHVNRPPVFIATGNQVVTEGQPLSFIVCASDPDGDQLIYCVDTLDTPLPPGATFDPMTRTLTWTPGYDQAGNYSLIFTVADNGSPIEVANETVSITVGNVNRPPVFTAIGTQQASPGNLLQFAVKATDPDGDALSYSVNDLPAGAAFDAATQTFSWTPGYDQAGTYSTVFNVTDSGVAPLSGQLGVVIVVNGVTPCDITNEIIRKIQGMKLFKAVENSYMANLKSVCPFIESGKLTPAANQIDAFIHKVESDASQDRIDPASAALLLQKANALKSLCR